jgi:hypothetical protein
MPVLTRERVAGCKYANACKASGAGFDSPRLSKRVRQLGIEDFGNNLNCPTVKRPICV